MEQNLSQKIVGNAMSAYLMVFVSGLFLFNKDNQYINNDFVKAHTKSALIIHTGFLVTYIIFIGNSLFSSIKILGLGLNNIIADIIFCFLLGLLILGMYKAKNGELFNIGNNINISNKQSILDIDGDGEITEKEKLTIIMSYIPFIGFILYDKNKNNPIIQDGTRLNIFITLIITLFYIFGYNNLSNLIMLIYIITITFLGINLFTREQLIIIKLPKIFSPENFYNYLITFKEYIKNYFSNNNFKEFSETNILITEKITEQKINDLNIINQKDDLKIHKFLIYIPFVNLIFLFNNNNKYHLHIKNGLTITFLIIISIILVSLGYINSKIYLLFLFPILFGIGYTGNNIAYRMPFIYDIYSFTYNTLSFLKFSSKTINEKRKQEIEVNLKVKEFEN